MRRYNAKTWKRKTLILLFLVCIIIFKILSVNAEEIVTYGYNRYRLNIRAEMSVKSKWIDQYPEYSTILILEDFGDWYRVENGYVKKEYVYNEIDIYEYGKILEDTLIYSDASTESEAIGTATKDMESGFVHKTNGFLELETGGFVEEKFVTFDFSIDYNYDEKIITVEDMQSWNMSYLPIKYMGTLKERTSGQGVTTRSTLYFKDIIPIYEIIEGEAYFPSGNNIYKIPVDSFSTFENVGISHNILAAYRTIYYTSSSARKHNIALVSSFLDGTIINSGDTFSYNDTTGPRSASMGYREAPVIEYGQYVMGYGGGVCQVSSTIYAAIMNQNNFEVTEREEHGLSVSYLPYGMDATVSYGSIDLKFINNNSFAVKLNVKSEDGVCLVTITRID